MERDKALKTVENSEGTLLGMEREMKKIKKKNAKGEVKVNIAGT